MGTNMVVFLVVDENPVLKMATLEKHPLYSS